MNHSWRVPASVFSVFVMLILALFAWVPAAAQDVSEIGGTVFNGTTDQPLSGAPVTVVLSQEGLEIGRWSTITSKTGEFRIAVAHTGALEALVSVEYGSIPHFARFAGVTSGQPLDITVFDTVNSNNITLRENIALIIDFDRSSRELAFRQMLDITNESALGLDARGAGLLVPVPAGAFDLRIESDFPDRVAFEVVDASGNILAENAVSTEPFFVSMKTAVQPGPHRIVISGRIPAIRRDEILLEFPRAVEQFDVLVPFDTDVTVDRPGFLRQELAREDYRRWNFGASGAGKRIAVPLAGLPSGASGLLSDSRFISIIAVLALIVPVGLVLGYVLLSRKSRPAA